jgi:hypothetical protein
MDRRYKQSRFYNGSRAVGSGSKRSEALVRSRLARARRENSASQAYGGSTGGVSSAGGGISVIAGRNDAIKDAREIFRNEGSGTFGARANLAEVRGFRQPRSGQAAI